MVSGEKAAHGQVRELPGGGAEGGGSCTSTESYFLRIGEGGAELADAAGTGYARDG